MANEFRDQARRMVFGIPAQDNKQPSKEDMVEFGSMVDTMRVELDGRIDGITVDIEGAAAGEVVGSTLAELNATPGTRVGQPGRVLTGVDAGNYRWSGAAWVFVNTFLQSAVRLTITGGTVNAIIGTAPAADAVSYVMTPAGTNTAPVTVNGIALLRTNGDAILAGDLAEDRPVLFVPVDGEYRLVASPRPEIAPVQDFFGPDGGGNAIVDQSGNPLVVFDENGAQFVSVQQDFYSSDTDPQFVMVSHNGYALLAPSATESGSTSLAEGFSLVPYLDGDDLHAVGAIDEIVADLDGRTALATAPGNALSVRAVLENWPLLDGNRLVSAGPAGDGMFIPSAENILFVNLVIGQSLAVGASSSGTLINTEAVYPEDALMLLLSSGTSDVRMGLMTGSMTLPALDPNTLVGFTPLIAVSQNARGQTVAESCANSLAASARAIGVRYRTVSIVSGRSDTAYADLKKGSTAYDNSIAALTKTKELAEARGWKVIVSAIMCKHGESDSASTTYEADLIEWQSDYDADIKAITDQSADVHFIMHMPSSFKTVAGTAISPSTFRAVRAMLKLHNESPVHHVAGADYPWGGLYDPGDYVHFYGGGYFLIGEMYAAAQKDLLFRTQEKVNITQITAASRIGTTVTLTYDVPVGEIQIDNSTIYARTNAGFRFADSAGEVAINAVTKIGANQITLTLGATPGGTSPAIYYGTTSHPDERSSTTIPGGNIRDSAGDTRKSGLDGRRLDNWAVHQIFTF